MNMRRMTMNELITFNGDMAILNAETSKRIADFERKIKEIKQAEDELKQGILAEMEEKGVIKINTEELIVSYVAPTDRETFDSKRFKAEHQDIYDEYVKMSPVKASVRVKVK